MKFILESGFQIHTYEDEGWITKGKFDTAVEDNEYIQWIVADGEHSLPLFLVI